MSAASADIPWDLIQRYDQALPRYTSYPTVPAWRDSGADEARAAYERTRDDVTPISVYVHLPFCDRMCLYCGCNVIVAGKSTDMGRYLGALKTELAMVAKHLGPRSLGQLHLGGGTPTMFTPEMIRELVESVFGHFAPTDEAEVGIEVDPVVTTEEHFETARSLGFNRISLGVQDFDDEVQRIIDRRQWADTTRNSFQQARKAGFDSINLDLMYGLPGQTPEHLANNAAQTAELGADRVAVFGYAHVPWMRPHQKKLEVHGIPGVEDRWGMFQAARRVFLEQGYEPIGMDHFAKPEDELVKAEREGRLRRNFQGYTVLESRDLVGIGVSSIGDVGGAFLQNPKRLSSYLQAIEAGRLPTDKGMVRTEDDDLRREIIMTIMCNLGLEYAAIDQRFGIDFKRQFADELAALGPLEEDGIVAVCDDRITVEPSRRVFLRNVASVFDAYLGDGADKPRFSRTV